MELFDIIIIGAGVIGNAVARELSRKNYTLAVLDKEADAGFGISSRNSGVVHSGIHYTPGSNRAILNIAGNAAMESLCRDLSVPFIRTGKLTIAASQEEQAALHELKEQGEANGVPGMEMMDSATMDQLQPGIAGTEGLYTPSTGIVNPMALTIALAEHAHLHGVSYRFLHKVIRITQVQDSRFQIESETPQGRSALETRMIINCAGMHADTIAKLCGYHQHTIYPCRGEYYVLDKRLDQSLNLLIYPVPGTHSSGLGIHLTKTVEGNILIGPSNEYIADRMDCSTTSEIMEMLKSEGKTLLPTLVTSDFIRSFSGLRPKLTPPDVGGFDDFVIRYQPACDSVIHVLGIESPGLTAAPAIGKKVAEMAHHILPVSEKPWRPDFPDIPGIYRRPYPASMYSLDERKALVDQDPDFGSIICRCEEISLAEVRSALKRMFGPLTYAGIKNRCRPMSGRCQGGFCMPRIAHILNGEWGIPHENHMLKGPDSVLYTGLLRDGE